MVAAYPNNLPLPQVQGYRGQKQATTRRTAVLGGESRFRLIANRSHMDYAVRWIFSQDEFTQFKTFFIDDLNFGSDAMEIMLKDAAGLTLRSVHFVGEYNASMLSGGGYFGVTATLRGEVNGTPTP